MPRKKATRPPAPTAPATFKNQPFRGLKGLVGKVAPAPPPPPPRPVAPPPPAEPDDAELFRRAMAGARPLDEAERRRIELPRPAAEPRPVTHPDAEAFAELCDLVAGNQPFDITDSDEHVEGRMLGVDPRLVRKLRRGEFAYQGHLDLHGLTRDEARVEVDRFIEGAFQAGKRCVLIIHGRGLNSKDQIPVLKNHVTSWLARGKLGQRVLAFSSARACDGGAGALYVLLRRQRHKGPFVVLNGAKE